jgi:CubicO group peptidase (beta-lactamase class C family)
VTVFAGIDEAGYGPRLGPLVAGCAALAADGAGSDAGPGGLWERLGGCVCRSSKGAAGRVAVADSKALYSSGGTLARLERAALAFLRLADGGAAPEAAEALAARLLSGRCRASLAEHPWYADRGERLPLDCPGPDLAAAAEALARGCRSSRTAPAHFAARMLAEGEFNRRVERLGNKAAVLLELVAELLAGVRQAAGAEPLVIHVDRLGGRTDYGPLLAAAFPGGFAWQERATAEEQSYWVDGLAGPTRVTFQVKADRDCFAVALASMFSKYLRELYMRRFNAWWRELDPQIPETTGYHADAGAFLQAAGPHRERLKLADSALVRSR